MTIPAEDSVPTALDLLFGRGADAPGTLAAKLLAPGGDQELIRALAHFPETTRNAAVKAAADTAAGVLGIDVTGVLVRGWREHRDIAGAARRTLAAPGSTELVSISPHEVTLDQRPSVSVLVDGRRVASLELGVSLVFDIHAVLLGITAGRLTAVHSGRCDVTASLAAQGTDLVTRQAHLELPGVMQIRRGIRLLPIAEYPFSEEQRSGPHQRIW
jgi:hypothetical protein